MATLEKHSLLATLAETVWPPFGVAVLIGLPSALLYVAELVMMLRYWHKFDSSFFVLFIVRAVPNLLNLLTSYLGQRFGKLGLFLPVYEQLPRLALCFFYFAGYYFFHAENLANLFLLLNRLSSIALPFKYNQLWRFLCPLAIAITFLLPITITVQIFFVDMFLYKSDDGLTFTLNYTYFDGYREWPIIWRKGNNYMAAGSAVIFAGLCLGINAVTILLLRRKNIWNQQQQQKQRVERRMTIYALLSFLGQLLMAGYYVFFYWVASYAKKMFHEDTTQQLYTVVVNHYCWVNDISTVALPAWLMLWASERMRRLLAQECLWLLICIRSCCRVQKDAFFTGTTTVVMAAKQQQNNITRVNAIAPLGNGTASKMQTIRHTSISPSMLTGTVGVGGGSRRPSHMPPFGANIVEMSPMAPSNVGQKRNSEKGRMVQFDITVNNNNEPPKYA